MKVRVWDNAGTGLLIPCKSGIIYSNQTGGTSCLQMELEGAFVPFNNDVASEPYNKLISKEEDLFEYFFKGKWNGTGAVHGLDEDDAKFIDSLFTNLQLKLKVDRTKLKDSHEAWVWVILTENEDNYLIETEFPCKAVLTWSNSD